LWAFNTQFERTRRRRLDTKLERIETLPDVDGDGVDEIVGYTRLNKKAFLFTPDFHIKATYQPNSESRIWIRNVLRTGFGETPFLLAEYDNQTVALRLVPNRFYWFDRYGLPALLGFGLILIIGTVIGVRSLHRRKTLIERLHSITLDAADQGFLVLGPAGHITAANSAFRIKLGLDASAELDDKHYVEALSDASPFASFLDNSISSHPPHHHNEVLSITSDGLTRTVQARIEPVTLPGKRRPYWLVSVQSDTPSSASEDAHTWAMMAKKVMHDIKNPLTNILLTAQRLQSEHHKRVPDAAPTLNSYPERIIERVTHLRRMTKQFMKVLDVDALDLVKTNPSTLVHNVHQKLCCDLPPDIKLVLDVQPDLPSVLVDREQMQSVLENLVTNAVHALPDGGTITISAYSVPNLCTVHSAYEPRDYTVLEVQDNGVGISEEDRPRLFEPGFTTLEFGTGLGLALIKKAVDHHNGFIEVESEPGVGSVFSVHLPFANTPP
jgi:two-component system nitrogen regulation sensor histidine kinase NtrY